MRIFVYEHVCGGGWPAGPLAQSLATEGGAMLRALCEDLSRLPEVAVTTTLDTRCFLEMPAGVDVIPIPSIEPATKERHEQELLRQSLAVDATVVIAPELDNMLASRVRALREAGANVIAPPDGWLERCSNKRRLSIPGVAMIPMFPLERKEPHNLKSERAVIKPAFGAGSQTLSVISTENVEKLRSSLRTHPQKQLIVQPFVPGTAVSVATVMNEREERTILPVARQILSDDDHLQYQGGVIPWTGSAVKMIQQSVRRCHDHMPGLIGYVGFDFVIPDANPDEPLLVEINPRLCTSYLGYRRLTDDNLAALMLPNRPQQPIHWQDQIVRFQPDGSFEMSQPPEGQRCV